MNRHEWPLIGVQSYTEFIIEKLSIPDEKIDLYIPDTIPEREELLSFAAEKGVGIEKGASKREILEKLLYEFGITNLEIKDRFRKHLGIEEIYFIEKYQLNKDILKFTKEKNLFPVVHSIPEQFVFLDAEYYFSRAKTEAAIKIYERSGQAGQYDT